MLHLLDFSRRRRLPQMFKKRIVPFN